MVLEDWDYDLFMVNVYDWCRLYGEDENSNIDVIE